MINQNIKSNIKVLKYENQKNIKSRSLKMEENIDLFKKILTQID